MSQNPENVKPHSPEFLAFSAGMTRGIRKYSKGMEAVQLSLISILLDIKTLKLRQNIETKVDTDLLNTIQLILSTDKEMTDYIRNWENTE